MTDYVGSIGFCQIINVTRHQALLNNVRLYRDITVARGIPVDMIMIFTDA